MISKSIFLLKILFIIENKNKKLRILSSNFVFFYSFFSFNGYILDNITLRREWGLLNNRAFSFTNIINSYIKLVSLLPQRLNYQGLYHLNCFIVNYLKIKIDKNICLELSNYFITERVSFSNFLKLIKNRFKKLFALKRLHISYNELVWIFYLLFKTKDLTIFKNWIKTKFITTKLKLHKNLISLIKYSVKVLFINYLSYFSLLGFYFRVKGKISASGSSKKRMIKFGIGKMSRNTKPLRIGISEVSIKTSSGMIGINLSIMY